MLARVPDRGLHQPGRQRVCDPEGVFAGASEQAINFPELRPLRRGRKQVPDEAEQVAL